MRSSDGLQVSVEKLPYLFRQFCMEGLAVEPCRVQRRRESSRLQLGREGREEGIMAGILHCAADDASPVGNPVQHEIRVPLRGDVVVFAGEYQDRQLDLP